MSGGPGRLARPLGIEFISVCGLPPVEFVHLAADLGCRHISTALASSPGGPSGYPPFSLRDDPVLRRALTAALAEREVSISLGEGLVITRRSDVTALSADLDVLAGLGAGRINSISFDRDVGRTFDQLAPWPAWRPNAGCAPPWRWRPAR